MQVSEIMHHGVVSVNINESIKKVAALMKEDNIGSIPVLEEGRPVGIITDRDIVISCVAEGTSIDSPVSQAMSEDVVTIHAEDEITVATKLMRDNQVSRLLVLDENEKPVGMLSLSDLSLRSDETLTGEILGEIKKH